MPHRSHLFSLRLGHAIRESCFKEEYGLSHLTRDLLAGVTVGIIAIPLAMALAIASGLPPQYGLYTTILGGFIIALLGGSRYSISGPTAAFVVILFPITQAYGLAGLLIASALSGLILVIMAILRLGRLIEYIPESVTLGFTAGIAVVIATLQLEDVMGLHLEATPESLPSRLHQILTHTPDIHPGSVIAALVTLTVLILWQRCHSRIPAHLPAILVATLVAGLLNSQGIELDTIGSRFTFIAEDGSIGHGVPSTLPSLQWPWQHQLPDQPSFDFSLDTIRALIPSAFAIAMLGAIESLLCAVVLDGMSRTRHSANSELLGQGIGNLIVPFFGGITATAAIARSATNFKSGAYSPIAAMIHAVVVLLALLILAPWLSYIPMSGMSALLLFVAWNMSEAPKAFRLIRTAPATDIIVFSTCFTLTVFVDMVVAIGVGIVLASLLFLQQIAAMTKVTDISEDAKVRSQLTLPSDWAVYKINGPLFFAAAERLFAELAQISEGKKGLVLYLDAVTVLDAGGLSAMERWLEHCANHQQRVMLADFQFQPLRALARAEVRPVKGCSSFHSTLAEALDILARESTGKNYGV